MKRVVLSVACLTAALVFAGCSAETSTEEEASEESMEQDLHSLSPEARDWVGEYAAVDVFNRGTAGVRGLSLRSTGWYTVFRTNGTSERGRWTVRTGQVSVDSDFSTTPIVIDHPFLELTPSSGVVRKATIGPTYMEAGMLLGDKFFKRLTPGACSTSSCRTPSFSCSEVSLRPTQTSHACVESWATIVT